jgi:cupin 2 domain-containing protein
VRNLFRELTATGPREAFETLLEGRHFRLERIVSAGHATPAGEWYDEVDEEWVVLLAGSARLRFEDEPEARTLGPGDWILIAPHRRHRVEWTDPDRATVWLALHHHADERRMAGGPSSV